MKNTTDQIKSFDEILKEFSFSFKTSSYRIVNINKLILKGKNVSSAGYHYTKNTSLDEALKIRDKFEKELNRKFVLELIASFEAKTVFYFKYILKRKSRMYGLYRDSLSRRVRNGYIMYQHIIPIFRETIYPLNNKVYSDFVNLVDYRNWLAHGRGWDLPNNFESKFDFPYSYNTISLLMALIPDYPDNLKT